MSDNRAMMDKIISLTKRRGFIFQSSEIYGGIGGFWDYGPLGVELKRNIKAAWWGDMVTSNDDTSPADGAPAAYGMVGLDTAIEALRLYRERRLVKPDSIMACARIIRPYLEGIL